MLTGLIGRHLWYVLVNHTLRTEFTHRQSAVGAYRAQLQGLRFKEPMLLRVIIKRIE